MAERLAKRDVKPILILASPATRALTTAEIIGKKLGYKGKDIVVDDQLYAVEATVLLRVIRNLDDKFDNVMLLGHNPELTEFAQRLSSNITHRLHALSPNSPSMSNRDQMPGRSSLQEWCSTIQRSRRESG